MPFLLMELSFFFLVIFFDSADEKLAFDFYENSKRASSIKIKNFR